MGIRIASRGRTFVSTQQALSDCPCNNHTIAIVVTSQRSALNSLISFYKNNTDSIS